MNLKQNNINQRIEIETKLVPCSTYNTTMNEIQLAEGCCKGAEVSSGFRLHSNFQFFNRKKKCTTMMKLCHHETLSE